MSRTRGVFIDGIPERSVMDQWVDSLVKFEEQLKKLDKLERERRSSETGAVDGLGISSVTGAGQNSESREQGRE